jgi:AraC-like DNA-binding protein
MVYGSTRTRAHMMGLGRKMIPDLELVHIRKGESFAAWMHGYPFRTVRWHYHPEYEIHLVAATSGTFYIGDHIGRFEPGQLIMTAPNLPQNWISEVPSGHVVPMRSLIIQFPSSFIKGALETMQEAKAALPLLELSSRGLLFDQGVSAKVRPLMEALIKAHGVRRLALFWEIMDVLVAAPAPEVLASPSYTGDVQKATGSAINRAIAHLRENVSEDVSERDLAELVGMSRTAFSRAFKRHTGLPLIRYRNQLRIDLACQMLVTDFDEKISNVCHDVGFSNVANFNRQFLKVKGMSPSVFRAQFAANRSLYSAA